MRLALLALLATPAAADCTRVTFEEVPMAVCEVHAGEDLRLFLNDATGRPYGGFGAVDRALAPRRLVWAMNAGMYQPDLSPVGLYIEDGVQAHGIVTSDGPGNFGLLPNGVFCIGARFSVVESRAFKADPPDCDDATQSGPMLVIAGDLHPAFKPDSDSLNIRNGVGVSGDGKTAWFVLSEQRVNFDRFARFFRDHLGARDALYFDGSISRLYAPEIGRQGGGFAIGPMVGVVE
ncbi:phosphodiester glycosidase family protein [Rhodobacter sp. KR11]|uniref:phosphodiester glycosidase family protein n=1 Tax=Rhodobacter sp. KR11 TaxID=2974588 RepID=UPI00222309C6|nr:phosphodiester glycosidase family protein [Rhodobacter sp. KR11]MCW1918761.1 phosphodiester glycosidase family protein [Rhodobacter sp. KR11]